MHHLFDISIATKYDVNIAIFLNNLLFWLQRNIANEKHFYDGRYWTYNSVKAYAELFPYWSEKQIRTIIERCIDEGLILKGNYNQNKYDQTAWYALTDEACKLLNFPILPNGQIKLTKRANQNDQMGKPIPDINTDNKTDSSSGAFFKPNEANQKLAQEYGLDLQEELRTFHEKFKAIKTQAQFANWLENGLKRKNEKKISKPVRTKEKESYSPCSGCKRPMGWCECNLASRETNISKMAELKAGLMKKLKFA